MSAVKSKKSPVAPKKATGKKAKPAVAERHPSEPSVWRCKVAVKFRGLPYKVGQTMFVSPHQEGPELEKYFEKTETETIKIESESAQLLGGNDHGN